MQNRHYLGDDFYPPIIDQETFDKAEAIRLERAGKLGRLNRTRTSRPLTVPTRFRFAEAKKNMKIRGCRQSTYTASLKARRFNGNVMVIRPDGRSEIQ
jgi:hypothetical protein